MFPSLGPDRDQPYDPTRPSFSFFTHRRKPPRHVKRSNTPNTLWIAAGRRDTSDFATSPVPNELCLYDLHPLPFDTTPFGVPVSYDAKRNRYELLGYFCSPPCVKAYILRVVNKSSHSRLQLDWFEKFMRDEYGHTGPIRVAPPRELMPRFFHDCNGDAKKALAKFRGDPVSFERAFANTYVRVTHLYEVREADKRIQRKEQRDVQLMTQRPHPIVVTQRGQMEQWRMAERGAGEDDRTEDEQPTEPKRSITRLMGAKRKRNQ